jgi:peptide/nickel transport system substrate-binding protein
MRSGTKRLTGLIAIAAAALMVASACSTKSTPPNGGSLTWKDCVAHPNDCNSGQTKQGGTMLVTDEKKITSFFVADAASNTYDQAQIMSGLIPSPFTVRPDSSVVLNTDLMDSATLVSSNPQKVEYKIKQAAVWNDGTPITGDDFTFAWKFQDGKDCSATDCPVAGTTGYDSISDITSSDNGKTVDVTWSTVFPDWRSLFALWPSKVATTYAGGDLYGTGGLAKAYKGFLNEAQPAWSGGPYVIQNYTKDVSTTLVPNPKWYGATKPSLDKIIYKIILDSTQEVDALKNGEINVSNAQPDADMVAQVAAMPNTSYNLSAGPTWEHIDLNLKNQWLGDKALRQAIFTAINRQDIISKTVLPFFPTAVPLNSHNYMPGTAGYSDVITPTGQGAGDLAKAKSILEAAGYTGDSDGGHLTTKDGKQVGTLRFSYTQTNKLRETTAELVQASLKQIGIDVKLTPLPDLSVLGSGDFDMIVFAWVGSPFVSGNKDLWSTDGGGNYGHYSNTTVDSDLAKAATDTDATQQATDFNAADQLMAQDAYVLPLYQKPVFIAVSNQFVNIRNNPTSAGPAYNMQEWGVRASAQ